METSSARPYFAIFAVVAIAVAAFILKNEFAGATEPEKATAETVDRMLVQRPGSQDRVPEDIPVWFKRVGYQKLGFASEDEMQKTQDMMTTRGLSNVTADQMTLIKKLYHSDNRIINRMGYNLMAKLQSTKDRKQIEPEVVDMWHDNGNKQDFNKIVSKWYKSGDKDLVTTLAKDSKDESLESYIKDYVWNQENPGK